MNTKSFACYAVIERVGTEPARLSQPKNVKIVVNNLSELRASVRGQVGRALTAGLRYVGSEEGVDYEVGEYISYHYRRGSLHRWFVLPLAAVC